MVSLPIGQPIISSFHLTVIVSDTVGVGNLIDGLFGGITPPESCFIACQALPDETYLKQRNRVT